MDAIVEVYIIGRLTSCLLGCIIRSFGFGHLATVSRHFVLNLKSNAQIKGQGEGLGLAFHIIHQQRNKAKTIFYLHDLLYITAVYSTTEDDCSNTEADDDSQEQGILGHGCEVTRIKQVQKSLHFCTDDIQQRDKLERCMVYAFLDLHLA